MFNFISGQRYKYYCCDKHIMIIEYIKKTFPTYQNINGLDFDKNFQK